MVTNRPKKEEPKESKEIVYLEPRELDEAKTNRPEVKIGSIGTLNLFLDPFRARYERHYRENKWHLVFDLVLVAIVLILVGLNFKFWLPGFLAPAEAVSLEIKINPTPTISGNKITYSIDYFNKTKTTLKGVNLTVRLPSGLTPEEFLPNSFDPKTNTLEIGDLEPGANGEVKITGRILNAIGDSQKIIILLNYQDQNGRTNQEIAASSYLVQTSALEANLDLPSSVSNHSQFKANLKIKNNSTADFDQVKLTLAWPKEINILESDLPASTQPREWLFSKIRGGETKNFSLSGLVSSSEIKDLTFETDLALVAGDHDLIQDKKIQTIKLVFSNLALGLADDRNGNPINPGNLIIYKLSFKNNESYNLRNLTLALKPEGEFIDWKDLEKNYQVKDNEIIWDQNNLSQLGNLKSGEGGQLSVSLKLLPSINITTIKEGGFTLKSIALANYVNPETGQMVYSSSDPNEIKINSSLTLKASALYYTKEGDQLGLGPIPPTVGKTTKYWLFLQINNTINPVDQVEISAHLPAGVELTGRNNVTEGNNLEFQSDTRQIKWTLDKIRAYLPDFYPAPEARIEIAITPTELDRGRIINLLDQIKISGTDDFTGAKLEATAEAVTTDIFKNPNLGRVK